MNDLEISNSIPMELEFQQLKKNLIGEQRKVVRFTHGRLIGIPKKLNVFKKDEMVLIEKLNENEIRIKKIQILE